MSGFHSRTVLSPPLATRCPSGLKATLYTASVWPIIGGPRGRPLSASYTRTVLSAPPVTSRCPSVLNATLKHPFWAVSGQRIAERLAGVGIPQLHRAIGEGGGQPVPVGIQRHTVHVLPLAR